MHQERRARDKLLPGIREARQFSDSKLDEIRSDLEDCPIPDGVSVVVLGSFARREATPNSDFDYFLYSCAAGNGDISDVHDAIHECLENRNIAAPSVGGAFGKGCFERDDFLKNIGGNEETNESLTRRLLVLLESDYATSKTAIEELRNSLIERYVSQHMTEHGLARFLLNDLIKYYRTICVDFEYKTVENDKEWGVRNIKLMFSRKLIYFSGILAIAETAQRHWSDKRTILSDYFEQTPIERVESICGSRCEKALSSYDRFIEMLSDKDLKERISRVQRDRETHDKEFRELKNEAHHFSWQLHLLLSEIYPMSHPIHHAIAF